MCMQMRAAVLLAATVFGAGVVNAADYGRTAGAFKVTPSGAATYTVPIWTPPGPNGLQPSISLSYSSRSGNGVGGVGWSLSVGSSIHRCDRSRHQDGAHGAVEMSTADRFCLDGKRLRLASGSYGAANSVYFAEVADYSRITAYGTQGNGPAYFIVEGKNGLLYEYGSIGTAQLHFGGTVHSWYLHKVSDRSGNNYRIYYINPGSSLFPSSIYWTPTSHGAATYRYRADFEYTTRPPIDSWSGSVAGFQVTSDYRLTAIRIKSNGTVVRKYTFGHASSTVTGRSLLTTAKECADEAESNCFLPISFTYQVGVGGVTAGATAAPASSSNALRKGRYDFNGDGRQDIMYTSGSTVMVALGAGNGFSGPYAAVAGAVDRFLPNGRDAIATTVGGVLWVYRWDDATSSFVGHNTGISNVAFTTTADFDGDGLADLVNAPTMQSSISVRRNISTGSGNPSFDSAATATASLSSGSLYPAGVFGYAGKGLQRMDVNGDGRQDLSTVVIVPLIINGQMQGYTSYYVMLLGTNTGFATANFSTWQQSGSPTSPALHFNGDQCTDRLFNNQIFIATCNGATASVVNVPATVLQLLDWNGDGKSDLLTNNGGTFGVYLSTGSGFSTLQSTSISSTGDFFVLDQDGDGLDDLIRLNGTSALNYWTHTASGAVPGPYTTNYPDLLSNVTDGFGVSISPSYTSTAWGNYLKGAATNYPIQESGPRIVVAKVTSSDGIGGSFDKNYLYVGARKDPSRREALGFQRFDETDARNGLITRTYFEQTFPVAGMVSQQELMQPNGTTTIARTVYTNGFATLDSAPFNQRYFTYPQASTSTQYEVGGTWNGNLLRTVATANLFDNATGALYDQTVTTTEPASLANGVTAGGSWTARTLLTNLVNDTTNWCLGRPGRTQQINSHNLTYGGSITRTTDISWNSTLCRPTQTVDEPVGVSTDPTLQVTTSLGYDTFGNVNSTTVTGTGMTGRTTSTVYSDATFTTGQFPLSSTNALGQTSTSVWNYDLGVPTSVTDPNGISISWLYDAFGRRIRENSPDGTYTTWDYYACPGCAPHQKTFVDQRRKTSSHSTFSIEQVLLDQFDRPIQEYSLRNDGGYNDTLRSYDALGRVVAECFPFLHSVGCGPSGTTTYDLLGRPVTISRPKSDTDSTPQTSTIDYLGLTTRITDAQLKTSHKVTNAAGQLVRSQDHDGYYQAFDYDPFGAPKRVQDSLSNTLQTSNYNLRGMLTARSDMDMGTWNFTPNALGEVVSQTDAKSQTTTFQFDLLGRMISRTEAEGTSTWTWGTAAHNTGSNKYIGGLKSISGPGYSETYTNDSLGRPSSTSISADTTYEIDYAYNNLGALDTLTYPTSTSSYRLKLQYEYQNGILYRIKDFNAPSTVFWTANAFNVRNQITQETLGNGLVTNRAFDAVTGWLKTIQTGPGGTSTIQNLAYTWDLTGSLKTRKDINQANLTEEFFYDNLYRLDRSTLTGVPGNNLELDYDLMGNITSKSDVGSYTYHATKKHQVTSTSNGWSFAYDNNGNMTSGRNATINWTSYNYPVSISNGADTSAFSYTPGRQYWRQISNYTSGGAATTIYVGGILEKVTTSAGTDFRHMIRAGGSTIIVSRQTSGTNSTHYVMSDHLGSSSAITNSAGGILVNSSFEAFGKRRGSNWTGSPSSGDWTAIASTTRRGFTDHTMLDNLALIHMNGRLYDPLLGKMISADPTVPGVSTQDFNRYAYVRNNPLSLSDPSGFAPGDFNTPERIDGDDLISGAEELARTRSLTAFQSRYPGGTAPRVWDYSGRGWFQVQHMQGHAGYISSRMWVWSPGHEVTVEPMDGAGSATTGSTSGHWEPVFRPLPTIGGIGGSTHGLRCASDCHPPAAPKVTSPGFWEVGGFAWNFFGVGTIDCLFNLGPNPCDASGWEIGTYVAGTVIPGLRGAGAAARGTATVIEHSSRHASVVVRAGDQVLHTEQLILAGRQTTIGTVEGAAPTLREFTVGLPDAVAAMRYQRSVIGRSTGYYDVATNSCVTHCGDVLRAGGLEVPGTTREIVKWLNSLGN
jgi:RHS repeat-associated protein